MKLNWLERKFGGFLCGRLGVVLRNYRAGSSLGRECFGAKGSQSNNREE
jgi:hypothetical protein